MMSGAKASGCRVTGKDFFVVPTGFFKFLNQA